MNRSSWDAKTMNSSCFKMSYVFMTENCSNFKSLGKKKIFLRPKLDGQFLRLTGHFLKKCYLIIGLCVSNGSN